MSLSLSAVLDRNTGRVCLVLGRSSGMPGDALPSGMQSRLCADTSADNCIEPVRRPTANRKGTA